MWRLAVRDTSAKFEHLLPGWCMACRFASHDLATVAGGGQAGPARVGFVRVRIAGCGRTLPGDRVFFSGGVALTIQVQDFALRLRFGQLPAPVVSQARRCLIDLVGVAAAGTTTSLSQIIRQHAVAHFGPGDHGASLLFDGRQVSPAGAALANAMTIDAYDAHDGHPLTKGHVGCGVFPALLACCEATEMADPLEFLTGLVVGYEIGTRAGIALHATADDYHTSGAWSAIACAAVAGRLLGLTREQMREAQGISEYHGPRSQMMRCIDHPTMVKDGSGWGAMAGVTAAYLAREGFTGAPAVTVEAAETQAVWSDLGSRWCILEQYFKPYPVCRWAQPAIEAVLQVARTNNIEAGEIAGVEIVTFHEAARLAVCEPVTTEAAQYSLPFPVAAALVHGTVGAQQITQAGLEDGHVRRLAGVISVSESDRYNAAFPAERWAHASLTLRDGRRLVSQPAKPRGDAEDPLSEAEIVEKFRANAAPVLGEERCLRLGRLFEAFPDIASMREIIAELGGSLHTSSVHPALTKAEATA